MDKIDPENSKLNQPDGPGDGFSGLTADAGLSVLLANISHELRIPMDAILGYVDLVKDTPLNDHQQTIMTQIDRAARGLLEILDDIHNLSRIETGQLEINNQPFSIRDCIDSVAQMLAPSAYNRGLDFIRVVDSDVPLTFLGDPLRIRQILINLIGNAIKFTRTGQVRLKISAHPCDDRRYELVFKVTDTGIGIEKKDIADLFKPFARPAKPQDDIGGTGLGLVICRSLCDQMGGSIAVHSTPGSGSTFCARLPLKMLAESFQETDSGGILAGYSVVIYCGDRDQASWLAEVLRKDGAITRIADNLAGLEESVSADNLREAVVLAVVNSADLRNTAKLKQQWQKLRGRLPVLGLVSSSSGSELRTIADIVGGDVLPAHIPAESINRAVAMLIQRTRSSKTIPAMQSVSAKTLAGLRLLVADDNEFSREYLQMLLNLHGAEVDVCHDGLVAYDMILEKDYDLVLMDVRMPQCDGVAAMKKLTQSGRACPPVIGLTAAPEECCRALNSGMTDCLLKPIRPSVLLQYIRNHQGNVKASAAPQAHAFVDQEMRAELNIELPRRAEELSTATTKGDMSLALEAAHKISGTAAICGFSELHATAASIEGLIRQHQLDGIERLTRTLKTQIEAALASLADS